MMNITIGIEKVGITPEGYAFAILIHPRLGHRCGYVGVPEGHPAYGIEYYHRLEDDLEVHGGVTFTDHIMFENNEESSKLWYVGFDAAHWNDAPDIEAAKALGLKINNCSVLFSDRGTIRSLDYMVDECFKLSRQLKTMEDRTIE